LGALLPLPCSPTGGTGTATNDVPAILTPTWGTKAETASRMRGRIEKVLGAAKAKHERSERDEPQVQCRLS